MTDKLFLEGLHNEGPLVLVTIIYEETYFTAKAYIAQRDAPDGSVYTARNPDGTITYIRTEQPIRAGLWAYPGDPEHFDQLQEPPLFLNLKKNPGGQHAD